MDHVLELDPGHVRTREHYEAMLAERMRELKAVAPAPAPVSTVAAFQAQQERAAAALRRGTRITEKRMPL